MTNPRKVAFRDAATLDAAKALITCGFELETQRTSTRATEGRPSVPLSPSGGGVVDLGTVDETAYAETVQAAEDNACASWSSLARNASLFPEGHWARNLTQAGHWQYLFSAFQVRAESTINALVTRGIMERTVYTNFRPLAQAAERGRITRDQFRQRLNSGQYLNHIGKPAYIDAGADGSVRGFEFRTMGAMDVARFNEGVEWLFANLDHVIDTGCSFHIHLAVAGVKHAFGERFQQALTEYLVDNVARVPASVKERWRGIANNRFITPGVSSEKYSFVHAHPQGTWEFRCFGNVKNAADGKACLDLAVEAMQHAYRVQAGMARLAADENEWSNQTWARAVQRALSRNETLAQVLPAFANG